MCSRRGGGALLLSGNWKPFLLAVGFGVPSICEGKCSPWRSDAVVPLVQAPSTVFGAPVGWPGYPALCDIISVLVQ